MTMKATRNCPRCYNVGPHTVEIEAPSRYELITRKGIAECARCAGMFNVRLNITRSDINPQREQTPRAIRGWSNEFNARPGPMAERVAAVDREREQELAQGEGEKEDVNKMLDNLKEDRPYQRVAPAEEALSPRARALHEALNEGEAPHTPNGGFIVAKPTYWAVSFDYNDDARLATLANKHEITVPDLIHQAVMFALDNHED